MIMCSWEGTALLSVTALLPIASRQLYLSKAFFIAVVIVKDLIIVKLCQTEAINDHCTHYNGVNNGSAKGCYTVGFLKCWQMLANAQLYCKYGYKHIFACSISTGNPLRGCCSLFI